MVVGEGKQLQKYLETSGPAHPGSVRTTGLELAQLQIQLKVECEEGSGPQTPAK